MDLPVFETQRLFLRAVTRTDAPAYERYFVDYEVIRNLSDLVPWPYPEGGVTEYIETQILPNQGRDRWVWGLFLKDHPEELIGTIDLYRKGTPENRGFWLGRKFWGLGLMTEAVTPITDCAFEALGFDRLVFSNAVGNTRSGRIKEKTGACLLYTEPRKFVDPEFTEHAVWELTKENWMSFRTAHVHPDTSCITKGQQQRADPKP